MSSTLLQPIVSAIFIAKCSKCKERGELEACKVCDEAKCKKCTAQHLMEVEGIWDAIEMTFFEINNARSKSTVMKCVI